MSEVKVNFSHIEKVRLRRKELFELGDERYNDKKNHPHSIKKNDFAGKFIQKLYPRDNTMEWYYIESDSLCFCSSWGWKIHMLAHQITGSSAIIVDGVSEGLDWSTLTDEIPNGWNENTTEDFVWQLINKTLVRYPVSLEEYKTDSLYIQMENAIKEKGLDRTKFKAFRNEKMSLSQLAIDGVLFNQLVEDNKAEDFEKIFKEGFCGSVSDK